MQKTKKQDTTHFNVALRAARTACKCVQLRATHTLRATALGLGPPSLKKEALVPKKGVRQFMSPYKV